MVHRIVPHVDQPDRPAAPDTQGLHDLAPKIQELAPVHVRSSTVAFGLLVTNLLGVGLIGTCSLFSTMTEFTDHEAAQLAATSVADALFQPEQPPAPPSVSRRQLLGG